MLSSRCRDKVSLDGRKQPMAVLRQRIKTALEALTLADEPVFEVWIHEDEAVTAGDEDSWQACMRRAKSADVMLVLYNGRAGWLGHSAAYGGEIGICHAEFAAAFDAAPRKVRTVQIQPLVARTRIEDRRFQEYFLRQRVLGAQVETGEDAIVESQRAAIAALLELGRAGAGAGSRGKYFAGEALEWSRLDFAERRARMTAVLVDALHDGERTPVGRERGVHSPIAVRVASGRRVAFVCDAIPAAMSTAPAREMVGQPFLGDHRFIERLDARTVGPVHVIACHRSVTEAQAIRQLGFPDAVVVTAPFGVYVADDVQKIQMVFIANCRDETTTRHNAQEFLRWLEAQGEDRFLAARAAARKRIGAAVLKEQVD